ncbi:MAG TPA: helix-hairpin-helix domain-containing protein [Flavisolibacter sp.]|nr:helix-hairpin-helix domain-containing protein [Flavisolibacter sp.]
MKKFVRDSLHFSQKDRLGILLVLSAIAACYLFSYFTPQAAASLTVEPGSELARVLDTLKKRQESSQKRFSPVSSPFRQQPDFTEGELFAFDPNTLDEAGWKRLGLSERLAKTIGRYQSKGGRFHRPEDLLRIWGFPKAFFERIKPYIRLPRQEKTMTQRLVAGQGSGRESLAPVNVNEADSGALIALPGIGSRLAARIITFRDRLGGFYAVGQIAETFGLADSVFQKIRPLLRVEGPLRKININAASKEELKNHPYIRWKGANAIVEYRNQHGAFKDGDELMNITVLDEATIKKLLPYLEF